MFQRRPTQPAHGVGTIAPIYLLDAVAELLLIGAWVSSQTRSRRTGTPRRRSDAVHQLTTARGT